MDPGQIIRYRESDTNEISWTYGICLENRQSMIRVYTEKGVQEPLQTRSNTIELVTSPDEIPEITGKGFKTAQRSTFKQLVGVLEHRIAEGRSLFE